jgi:aspartyl-tRNA(Asn)/glutamyl-tRNA(Gln) amidotransferase subunit A
MRERTDPSYGKPATGVSPSHTDPARDPSRDPVRDPAGDSARDPAGDQADGSIADLSRRLRDGSITSVTLTTRALRRIEAANPRLNAVVTLLADEAMRAAREADAEIAAGRWRGHLHGIPVGLKDIVDTQGVRTTMGSDFFRTHVPDIDAEVARRLRAAGAVLVGKLHTHEFAYGPTGDTSCFGPVRNPHDPDRVAGGSSGGSAVAVATGMCLAAVGSDTGGSIRIPSALCGVVGIKPTFGLVSRRGVFPLSWTLDHVGPITRSVADNALVLAALCGDDPSDAFQARRTAGDARDVLPDDLAQDLVSGLATSVEGVRIGVVEDYYYDRLQPEVDTHVRAAIRAWQERGAVVKTIRIPDLDQIRDAHRTVVAVEAYVTHRQRLDAHPELFGSVVRQRLVDGGSVAAWEYAEACRWQAPARRRFDEALREVDVLVTPSVPLVAPELGQVDTEAAGMPETVRSALTRLAGPTNLTGHPGLSVPYGRTPAGLPVGVQVIGRYWDEARLYRLGRALEQQPEATPVSRP